MKGDLLQIQFVLDGSGSRRVNKKIELCVAYFGVKSIKLKKKQYK